MPPPTQNLRLAVDIGGTFTDSVLFDKNNGILASNKTLTSHKNPADAALQGAHQTLKSAGAIMSQVNAFVHGTTLATNALIEKRGATVATITTEGFRDILEIAYERRYSQYDINLQKPDFLVSREHAFTINERMAASGEVIQALDDSQIPDIVDALRHHRIDAVAICLLHAYANASHERRIRSLLEAAMPELRISISSEVSPEAREFDRLCTTVANAYIQPLMQSYLSAFAQQFKDAGLNCPILMMSASGGMTTIDTAAKFPIRLVESGPAGGAILAAHTAKKCHLERVLSFDMGGTTAKLCLIDNGAPLMSRQFEIARAARFIKGSGMPVRIPVVDMIEIGAGGGSIASLDSLNRILVGPRSAGSQPGPVSFGLGGSEATVTDADVVLGYIQPSMFAEGAFDVDKLAAAEAILSQIGTPLSLDCASAADGISRIVDENMANASRMHAVESGKELSSYTMVAFGGNGPLHACRVARAAGVSRILIPNDPGVGSAVGFLYAPVSFEIVKSHYSLLSTLDVLGINLLLDEIVEKATETVRLGDKDGKLNIERSAFMRYSGQGHEIEIQLPDRPLVESDKTELSNRFEVAYSQQYSRPVPGMAIEILNWSVSVAGLAHEASATTTSTAPQQINH